jgi:hypothetical protein
MSYKLGPSGGIGGMPFADEIPDGARIVEVRVRSGARIDAIQVVYETADGEICPSPQHGESGGDLHTLQLGKGEFIVKISGRFGARVDSINIVTEGSKKSDSLGFHAGGTGGDEDYNYEAPPGMEIIGFHGRAGQEVDAIGVIIRSRQQKQISTAIFHEQ